MKHTIHGTLCASLILAASGAANAALVERLGGLAYYDTEADLTWLADANYAQTSGYDADGYMTWATANAWAGSLDINGVTGWRLPDTVQPDASCSFQGGSFSQGYGCTGSEMGNLFYNVLGGVAFSSITSTHNANYDLFSNVQSNRYWSAPEYAPDANYAWYFSMNHGNQHGYYKTGISYAWAVHSGDVGASVVPVPAAVWLFGSGLLGLIGVGRKRRR